MQQLSSARIRPSLSCCLLAAFFACMLVGCGDSNRNRLIGQWGITAPEAVMDRIDQVDQPSDLPTQTEISQRMVLTFKRNGVLNTKTRMGDVDQEKTGTWKLISFDGASKLMVISCEINTQTSEHETRSLLSMKTPLSWFRPTWRG